MLPTALPLEPLPLPDADTLRAALASHGARWVECSVGDFTATARGKRVAAADFVGLGGCRLPSVVLGLTLSAGEPDTVFGPLLPATYDDMVVVPDLATLVPRPGRSAEVSVICEPVGCLPLDDGRQVEMAALSPRAVLRGVLARLAEHGLQATVAPELELFLLDRAQGTPEAARPVPGFALHERSCDALSLERLTHFEPYFDALFSACEVMGIPVNGHAHESALSQYEVNFRPGPPLAQADAVWRFKRLAREIAVRHGVVASFAAKPFLQEPGTGMHWHLSLQRTASDGWPHVFSLPDGQDAPALHHFIAGVQAEAAGAMALFAPYGMSWDRIRLSNASPSHATWGRESRALALRIPASGASSRRVENRLPGGDANPYLVLAATLGLGWAGLQAQRAPLPNDHPGVRLPTDLPGALDALRHHSPQLRKLLGEPLVALYAALKQHEHAQRQALAHPRDWDMAHLLELA